MMISFEHCEPTEEHAKLIMTWRNDPITLAMSYHSTPKVWPDFFHEYASTYFNAQLPPLFAVHQGKKFGFIKFSNHEALPGKEGLTTDISINISPEMRSQGLGALTLQALSTFLKDTTSVKWIIAEVKENNPHSLKTFINAGYEIHDKQVKLVEDINLAFDITRLIKAIDD